VPNINIGDIILGFVVFLFSLTLHELGHAWTSEKFGDPTGRYLGRISLDPTVHIDPIGTILFPLAGMIFGMPVFGWAKPVPVNPLNWKNKVKANIAVSAAGPAANVLILVVSIIIFKVLIGYGSDFLGVYEEPVFKLLGKAIQVNVILAVFNMIPVPPLDGSHILSSILSVISPNMMESYESLRPYGFMILMALMITGAFGIIYSPVMNFVLMILRS
jgi:Zn-dependent protease